MTRISRYSVTNEVLIKVYQLFFNVLRKVKTKDSFLTVVSDLLSPTEKIMIAKRLTIIYLLLKGVNQATIAKVIKVSTSTVGRYAIVFHDRDSELVKIIQAMITQEKALHAIDDFFADLFIQQGFRIGHWQQYWDHKKQKEKRKVLG